MGVNSKLFKKDLLPKEFECPICKDALEDPYITSKCQHTFCGKCLLTALGNNSSCPICRAPLEKDPPQVGVLHRRSTLETYSNCIRKPDKYFQDKLGELELTCPFKECGKVIEYAKLKAHQKDCQFNPEKPVFCAATRCHKFMKRRERPFHQKFCLEYRLENLKAEMESRMRGIVIAKDFQISEAKKRISKLEQQVESLNKKLRPESAKLAKRRKRECDSGLALGSSPSSDSD